MSEGFARRLAGLLMDLRGSLRRLLPKRMHFLVGYGGRRLVRALESRGGPAGPAGIASLVSAETTDAATFQRIALVNDGLSSGGAERQIVNLATGLAGRLGADRLRFFGLHLSDGHDRLFFKPEMEAAGIAADDLIGSGEAREYIDAAFGDLARRRLEESLAWMPGDVRNHVLCLAADFHRHRIGLVHGWQDAAGIAAAFAGLAVGAPRIIVSARNMNPENFTIYRPYMKQAYRFLAEQAAVHLVNNSRAGASDYADWLGIAHERIDVIYNGVSPSAEPCSSPERREWSRRQIDIPPEAVLIVGFFRLQEEKRPLLWLEASRRLLDRVPEAHFAVYGAGTMENTVRSSIRRLGMEGRFRLNGPTRDVAGALAAADLLLLTSRFEGTPNIVLEAAAAGIPSVVTDSGGSSETVLPGRTGTVIPRPAPGETDYATMIAQACETILKGNLRACAALDGPRFVYERFGLERMIEETIDLYGLAHRPPSKP